MDEVLLIGRVIFGVYFAYSGLNHFMKHKMMVGYSQSAGVPAAGLAVPFTGLMLLFGGVSLILGWEAQWGAGVLAAFLLPTAGIMHRFWGVQDQMMAANQMAHFLKNVALAAVCLMLIGVFGAFGPGPFSLS